MSDLNQFLANIERKAFRTAMLATQKKEDALDIVQDSMLKLVQNYGHKPEEEWPKLFHRILHHRIIDWHRSNKRNWRWLPLKLVKAEDDTVNSDDEAELASLELITSAEENPSKQLELTRDVHKAMKAIEDLPLRQQQAFLLRAWEGFDIATTADIMGCTSGSVKTHYFRAQQALKKALVEDE